jgi:flavin-dependent dehydrogenase
LREIEIIGGGPAGASAALAALKETAAVRVHEKSRFPRHKVCGEFLSPEIAPLLERLGMFDAFTAARPARIRRLILRFRSRAKQCALPEVAYGLSRYRFDHLLLERALSLGCSAVHETHDPQIVAHGRKAIAPRGRRLFGFKAHFEGPADDAVELYFFNGCYVGINTVEDGITNVCGLGPEHLLRARAFEIDQLIAEFDPLRERLGPLRRTMDWMTTGPLVFETHFNTAAGLYPAGDALSFVDPFTGSGIVSAVLTGSLAGTAAARGTSVDDYLRECRQHLQRPFLISSVFRKAVANGWGEYLAPFVPGAWMVRLTRPA